MTNAEGGNPDPSSLFNVQTLKKLIELGQQIVDITVDKEATLTFNSDWDDLTARLGLGDNRRTYLIWLWIKYANSLTVNREQDGGNSQIGMLSQVGAIAIMQGVGIMEAELPVVIYAY